MPKLNKDGRELKNIATLTIAEYVDTPGSLHVNLKYTDLDVEAAMVQTPQSFKVMQWVYDTTLAPNIENVEHREGVLTSEGTSTIQ